MSFSLEMCLEVERGIDFAPHQHGTQCVKPAVELFCPRPKKQFGLCVRPLLKLSRETINRSQKLDYALLSSLERDPLLSERLRRLRTVPGVGPITVLTWVLEIGDVARFPSIKNAISYCGLCGAEKRSADKVVRTPISKQRNKHIQQVLVEAAKLAPRYSHELSLIYEKEKQRGNRNRATLAVARKMVASMVAVERRKQDFVPAEDRGGTVPA